MHLINRSLRFLAFAVIVSALGAAYAEENPVILYHEAWAKTGRYIYDAKALGEWKKWEHKFDNDLKTDKDAAEHIREMLASISPHDRHTRFLDAEQLKGETDDENGYYTGFGLVFAVRVDEHDKPVMAADGFQLAHCDRDGHPIVFRLIDGAAAEKAGLKVGDCILSVNGKECKRPSFQSFIGSFRGVSAGTAIKLLVRSDGQRDREVNLVCSKVEIPVVVAKHLPGRVGYLRIKNFSRDGLVGEVRKAIKDLGDCRSLIVDVRNNTGGYVKSAVQVTALFLQEGVVYTQESREVSGSFERESCRLTAGNLVWETTYSNRKGSARLLVDRQPNLAAKQKVVVLTNGYSASATEIFTGALKDNHRAKVVGTKTYGKGIGQSVLAMPDGCQLLVTSFRWYTPNGTWVGDCGVTTSNGLTPDVEVQADGDFEFGGKDDKQLEKALELLRSR
jgi:carboxyl-terminal processing protease